VLEHKFRIKCYFATPYHSWERGSNENLNGLVRQYLPKGLCMKPTTQRDCNAIAKELNERPRKRYAFHTPQELYSRSEAVSHLLVEFKEASGDDKGEPTWASRIEA
jgi:transposase, IS30 family